MNETVVNRRIANRGLLLLTALLCLAALACRTLVGDSLPAGSRTLFQDDFSRPTSGWNRVSAPAGESNYADGMYRILVNDPNIDIWSLAGRDYSDARIEVDAYKVGGDRNNRFGIICRAASPTTFYTLVISSDGYYGIGIIDGPDYRLIGMDALQPTDAINQGSALNHIRADCVGKTLALYVNGVKLAEVTDDRLANGDVGLIAGTYDVPGVDIRFDNFSVAQP
ncbi:MAG: hypothetical protein ACKOC5_02270 [Chloroflexota bacterium]